MINNTNWLIYSEPPFALNAGISNWYIDAKVMQKDDKLKQAILNSWMLKIGYFAALEKPIKMALISVPTGGDGWVRHFESEIYNSYEGFSNNYASPVVINSVSQFTSEKFDLIVMVEDVVSTGDSIRRVMKKYINEAREYRVKLPPIGAVLSVVNRSGGNRLYTKGITPLETLPINSFIDISLPFKPYPLTSN